MLLCEIVFFPLAPQTDKNGSARSLDCFKIQEQKLYVLDGCAELNRIVACLLIRIYCLSTAMRVRLSSGRLTLLMLMNTAQSTSAPPHVPACSTFEGELSDRGCCPMVATCAWVGAG